MSSINGSYLILPRNCCQGSQNPCEPAFRGVESNLLPAQATQPLSYPPDTVEISATNKVKKQKGLSSGAKWGLGGLALADVATLAYVLSKGKVGAKQTQQIVEQVEFKHAKTIEEGKNFGDMYKLFYEEVIEKTGAKWD